MGEYVYVVSGRNTALGVYATMADAEISVLDSVRKSGGNVNYATPPGPCYREFDTDMGDFTIVAVKPTLTGPGPIFKQ